MDTQGWDHVPGVFESQSLVGLLVNFFFFKGFWTFLQIWSRKEEVQNALRLWLVPMQMELIVVISEFIWIMTKMSTICLFIIVPLNIELFLALLAWWKRIDNFAHWDQIPHCYGNLGLWNFEIEFANEIFCSASQCEQIDRSSHGIQQDVRFDRLVIDFNEIYP